MEEDVQKSTGDPLQFLQKIELLTHENVKNCFSFFCKEVSPPFILKENPLKFNFPIRTW